MSKLSDLVASLARPVCEQCGVFLWDVEFLRDGGRRILRVYIDSETGAGVDECERVSRALDPILDEENVIEEAYSLEVSTPGMERILRTPEHFDRYIGDSVEAKLFSAADGQKTWRGTLTAHSDGAVSLDCDDGVSRTFARENISRVRLSPDFSKYFQD